MRTLSRISTKNSTSAGLSGGEPSGDCSSCRTVDMMKGIICDSTPSSARSSGVIGGKSKSGERLLVSGVEISTLHSGTG